jgi:N-ethylmaleimide reductase
MKEILKTFEKNGLALKNHIVMAPMTRSRAIGNLPNDLMAEYYGQRSGAGLIVTEGTSPAPDGLGYARIPGVYSPAQAAGWKKTTDAVHATGSRIFLQLMHSGRIGHQDNLPAGAQLVGPSDRKATGQIFTDTRGLQEYSQPKALTTEGVRSVTDSFVKAAQRAVEAGFDGVELHAANGYLLEQFLNPNVNDRTDDSGGTLENRSRLILDIAAQTAAAIGKNKVGIRFSPYSVAGDLQPYAAEEVHQTYAYLAEQLDKLGIVYIHISANPRLAERTYQEIRSRFSNTIILCNGLTPETAEAKLTEGLADLAAFGRSFLANPDFVKRIEMDAQLNQPDMGTFYTPGAVGYTDYASLN